MGKKWKVLSIGHSYVVSMNRAILRELAKDPEFDVVIGAPAQFHGSLRSLSLEPEPKDSPLRVVPLRTFLSKKMHVFSYHPWDLQALLKEDFHCAHVWEEPYILAGYQVMRQLHSREIPFLFRTAQSLIKNYIFPFSYFERFCFERASHFIAGGHLVLKAMQDKELGGPSGQVLTLAVDTQAFQPFSMTQKQDRQKELGLSGPVIGFLGRLSEEKGCDILMEALSGLTHLDWSLLVMGSGPYQEILKKWARQNQIESRVHIQLFKHDEVPQVLPACDLLVCPSQTRPFWKEQFGRMIVEAFASGVPVIGSDSGEIPRVIGEAGVVLPEQDTLAWKQEIESFLKNRESFSQFIPLGRARAQIFSAERIAEQYKDVYRDLAALSTKSN